MRRAMLAVTVATLASVGIGVSSANPAARAGEFRGDCSLSGTVTFSPALTINPQPGRGVASARGTCTGTLSAGGHTEHVSGEGARYWATDSSAQMDCEGGPAPGYGRITVDGITVHFRLEETRVTAVSLLALTGDGWSGVGQAHALASADPLGQASACHGPGLRESPVDITVHS